MTLPDRIREALAQTEGHSTGPWQLDGGSMVIQDATGHAVCHFGFEGEAGQRVYPLFVGEDSGLVTAAPTLRGLLAEALAELERAQAERDALRASFNHAVVRLGMRARDAREHSRWTVAQVYCAAADLVADECNAALAPAEETQP